MTDTSPPLAILVKGWPRLSETFIAQELVALEGGGIEFDIWSLRHPTDTKTHPLHDQLSAKVHYLPEYLHEEPMRVLAGIRHARRMAGWPAAFAAFRKDLRRDITRNRVRRFGQACVLAHEAPEQVIALYAHFLHTPSSVARYAAILRGMPWSFSAHAKDIWTSPDWELQDKLNPRTHGAAFGATCTRFGAEHLNDLSKGTEVDLIYHGLDLKRFPDPPDRPLRKVRGKLQLLSVGRLVEKKGFDRLIDALALLPKNMDWHWTHIGGGALKDEMSARAAKHGINDKITWRGACDQPEVIEAMRQADLFVLPSRVAQDGDRDGLPNVLMEAASQLLPILSTPVSAIPEFITNDVHGLLCSDDPQLLARAIGRFAAEPKLGPRLADIAYARLIKDFQMQPGVSKLRKRLRRLLGEPH
ncbi:MAG: glycosyltransferase family 4 protein [Paracoccaceae bacterium]